MKIKLFSMFYKYALKRVNHTFLQNNDDYRFLLNSNVIAEERGIFVLPGSGVNLTKYKLTKLKNSSIIRFLYSGRIIGDKGINELVQAFGKVHQTYLNTELIFIGNFFPANPSAINKSQVQKWVEDGVVTYLGMIDNVTEIIADCDCVVLPSYREGMPRSILEASSMGKPVITVNSIGCKDAVDDKITGFVAKVKDVDSLAEAMINFIKLPYDQKVEMGLNGRRKMEREFDQQIVINKYLQVVKKLLND